MSKRNVEFTTGAYYHLYNRGADRRKIFYEEADYLNVIRRMKSYAEKYDFSIIAYCLMPNHYHWLVRQNGDVEARLLAQRVFNGYSKWFNTKYERTGTLFEGRFKAKLVGDEAYLSDLCRYIHANPLRDSVVFDLSLWPYSNYHEWMGVRSGTLIDLDFVNARFPDRTAYRDSIVRYVLTHDLPEALANYLKGLID